MGTLFGAFVLPDRTVGPLRARHELAADNSRGQRDVVRLEGLRVQKRWE